MARARQIKKVFLFFIISFIDIYNKLQKLYYSTSIGTLEKRNLITTKCILFNVLMQYLVLPNIII